MKAGRTVKKSLLEAEKGNLYYVLAMSLVTWKLEMVSNKVVNLAKDISRQNVRKCQLAYFSCL